MDAQMKRTWAEVDFDKLAHNYHALRGLAPAGTKYLGLVKADAYGHGAVPVAKKLSGRLVSSKPCAAIEVF